MRMCVSNWDSLFNWNLPLIQQVLHKMPSCVTTSSSHTGRSDRSATCFGCWLQIANISHSWWCWWWLCHSPFRGALETQPWHSNNNDDDDHHHHLSADRLRCCTGVTIRLEIQTGSPDCITHHQIQSTILCRLSSLSPLQQSHRVIVNRASLALL